MKNKNQLENIVNFLAEAGQLKRVKRSGWWVAGIKDPESVADHCFRCAVLGYLLAKMERRDPFKVLMMTLFNDIHEARINDLHKVGHRYIQFKEAEKKVFREQTQLLPQTIRVEYAQLRQEYEAQESKEAIIARDADILECILQAREYYNSGYKQTKSFMSPGTKHLRTKSARRLFKKILNWDNESWWLHLAEFQR